MTPQCDAKFQDFEEKEMAKISKKKKKNKGERRANTLFVWVVEHMDTQEQFHSETVKMST